MLCVRCCANEKFPFSSSLTISHSAVATEYFMWSSHTFYTHSGERNSANFTPIWAEKQQQSAGKAQFMRFTENIKIYDLIYIHHPANIANRERKLHSSPNNINMPPKSRSVFLTQIFFSSSRPTLSYLLDGLLLTSRLLLWRRWASNRLRFDESWRFRRWRPGDSLQTCQR